MALHVSSNKLSASISAQGGVMQGLWWRHKDGSQTALLRSATDDQAGPEIAQGFRWSRSETGLAATVSHSKAAFIILRPTARVTPLSAWGRLAGTLECGRTVGKRADPELPS